jgi:phosphoribosylformylglycinamidine synthase
MRRKDRRNVSVLWTAEVIVMPKEGVNDPQGEAILGGLRDLGYGGVNRVRAGKRFSVDVEAPTQDDARIAVTSMADRLLANPVIESYTVAAIERSDSEAT